MENLAHRVAIVGAGWAGLAAGVTLAAAGTPVTVFEAARTLGGRARTVELDQRRVDNGQHILIGAYTETLRVMRLVGAEPEHLLTRAPLALTMRPDFALRARRLPGRLGLAAGLLGARGLSLGERLGAARFLQRMRRDGFRIVRDQPVRDLLEIHEQSPDTCRYLWEPLCIAALNTPPARASASVFLAVLRDSIGAGGRAADLLLPRIDLTATFPSAAARYIEAHGGEIKIGHGVREIMRTARGWRLDSSEARYRSLVLACAPQHVIPLIAAFSELETERAALRRFEYEPILTCYLEYPNGFRLPEPMIGLASGMVQWVFDRGQLGGTPGLIAAVTSAGREHDDERLPDLALRAVREIATAFPGAPSPRWMRVIAERQATFACTPGLQRPANRTMLRDLVLAGDYTASDYPATLEAAVRSGVSAGQLVLDQAKA